MRSGFDFADILDEVVTRAVGESSTAEHVISARRSIYLILEEWHALQYNTWRVAVEDFSFSAGFPDVTMPATLDDVIAVTVVAASGTETPLHRVAEADYAQLADKDQRGQPSTYRLRRTEPPTLTLYPAGTAGQTGRLRVTYVRRPDAFDRGSNNIDAPSRWLRALIFGAAADLASKYPEQSGDRIGLLQQKYEAALLQTLPNDRDRSDFRWRIA